MNRLLQIWNAARTLSVTAITAVRSTPAFTGKLIHEHKAIRRGILIWTCYLVTHATHRVFENPIAITTPEAAAYATVTALLATAIAFYNRSKSEPPKQ
jgi:hypothetical protein